MALIDKPSVFVLVPGSFSPASFYEQVTSKLQALGYGVYETNLKSVSDGSATPATMYDDADYIHGVVEKLADQGNNVIVAVNSYGGVPGTEATKGLSVSEREHSGKQGGGALIGILYLASFIAPVGKCLLDLVRPESATMLTSGDPYLALDTKLMGPTSFGDLSQAEQEHYSALLLKHSTVSFTNKLTHPGYKYTRSTFAVSSNDKAVPPELQRQLVNDANKQGADIQMVELHSDHCPMISHPDEVVKLLLQLAKG